MARRTGFHSANGAISPARFALAARIVRAARRPRAGCTPYPGSSPPFVASAPPFVAMDAKRQWSPRRQRIQLRPPLRGLLSVPPTPFGGSRVPLPIRHHRAALCDHLTGTGPRRNIAGTGLHAHLRPCIRTAGSNRDATVRKRFSASIRQRFLTDAARITPLSPPLNEGGKRVGPRAARIALFKHALISDRISVHPHKPARVGPDRPYETKQGILRTLKPLAIRHQESTQKGKDNSDQQTSKQ